MQAARAVILDFNGTVAEDEAVLIGIYEELLGEHGLPFDAGEYPRYAGVPDEVMFGRLFEVHGRSLDAATADRLVRERIGRYRAAIDEVRDGKPHPESFITALAHINRDRPVAISPEHTVVIEDATDGVRAARAAGMRCVAIRGSAYDEATGLAELVVDRLTVKLARALLGFEP